MKSDSPQAIYNENVPNSMESDQWQVIRNENGWIPLNLRELWEYRELLFFFTWRDIKVRYKQTLLGVSWAVLQPFMQMVVFSVFFGSLAKLDSEGVPYPLFNYAALLPWTYFAGSLAKSSNSVVASGGLIKKVYFPRLIVPIAGVLGGLPDFFLSFLVMLGLMIFYSFVPNILSFVLLLPLLLLAMITALGVGLWLSALNALYRDIGYITPFLIQLWLFITPVVYSADLIENSVARTLYGMNPMVGVIQGFRAVLLGTNSSLDMMLLVSVLTSFIILVSGLYFYRRMEAMFADVV